MGSRRAGMVGHLQATALADLCVRTCFASAPLHSVNMVSKEPVQEIASKSSTFKNATRRMFSFRARCSVNSAEFKLLKYMT